MFNIVIFTTYEVSEYKFHKNLRNTNLRVQYKLHDEIIRGMRRAVELSCNHEEHKFFIVFVLREERGECDRGKSGSREGKKKTKSFKSENESIMIKLSQ